MPFFVKGLDFLVALVLRYILRYRLDVIRTNLRSSFHYETSQALHRDIFDNYRYLAKMLRQALVKPGKRLLERRITLVSRAITDRYLSEGKSVLVTFGHTGNWEWTGSFLGLLYPDQVCALYKKIKSRRVNELMYNRRLSHVNYLIEVKQTGDLIRLIKKKPVLVLMIADQNPGSDAGVVWTSFLGRTTAFVNGPESLALRYHLPVVYMSSLPTKKGVYELVCHEIYDGQEVVGPGTITQRFATHLEKNIRDHHSHWLWSHRRWKRKPPREIAV